MPALFQASSPLWWDVASAAVSAVATVVLSLFAGVQLYREHRRRVEQQAAVKARIGGIAYELRLRLLRWLEYSTDLSRDGVDPRAFEKWLTVAANTESLKEELERAEADMRAIMSLHGEAPEQVAADIRTANVYFLEGVRRIRQHHSTPRPTNAGIFDWVQLRKDAEADLRSCAHTLEHSAIDAYLLNVEGIQRRIREDEEPFQQLAQAIITEQQRAAREPPADS